MTSIPAIVQHAAQNDLKPSIPLTTRLIALWSWLNSAKGSLPPLVCRTVHATFIAHGSSCGSAFVISTIPMRTGSAVTVYLVVTVTMDRHQITIGVVSSLLIAMMHL